MPKKPHHSGTHHVRSRLVRQAAYADPDTRCGRCGRTLAEHPNTKTGKPPSWQAGHVIDGLVDGPLRPEADVCNTAAGARRGNGMRHQAIAGRW